MDRYSIGCFPIKGRFPKLQDRCINALTIEVTMDEVRHSVFSMAPLKALAVDDFHAKFYQANWNIVADWHSLHPRRSMPVMDQ